MKKTKIKHNNPAGPENDKKHVESGKRFLESLKEKGK
jgi:hypothetical protein